MLNFSHHFPELATQTREDLRFDTPQNQAPAQRLFVKEDLAAQKPYAHIIHGKRKRNLIASVKVNTPVGLVASMNIMPTSTGGQKYRKPSSSRCFARDSENCRSFAVDSEDCTVDSRSFVRSGDVKSIGKFGNSDVKSIGKFGNSDGKFRNGNSDGKFRNGDGKFRNGDEKSRNGIGNKKYLYSSVHFTSSKGIIRANIDHDLLLQDIFKKMSPVIPTTAVKATLIDEKIGVKGVKNGIQTAPLLIDNYESISPLTHLSRFCSDAKRCLTAKNAGGKSEYSESLSIQYFYERFLARKFVLEMDVEYNYFNCKICDFVCDLYGHRVGVSVTRAMKNGPHEFTEAHAYVLLKKKIYGLIAARSNVSDRHSFIISFLHVWCQNRIIAEYIVKAYPRVIAEDQTGTFKEIVVLASIYSHDYIYSNKIDV